MAMFEKRNIVTAIEIGTSKVCVLIGESSEDGTLAVVGRGEASGLGAVIKGEIADMDRTLEMLSKAIDQADDSSGRLLNESIFVGVTVTCSGISSFQGVGSVMVTSSDRRVSDEDVKVAVNNAQINQLPFDRTVIETMESYFLLDGHRRVSNPREQIANSLDAHLHVIHGDTNRINNFLMAMRDAGFDDSVQPIFSGLATAFGVLTEDEKHNGVLLVDMGAGATEYVAVYNMGVLASGVVPVGFEHVINDLSLVLNLPVDTCRKLISEGILAAAIKQGKGFIELKNLKGKVVKIPTASFEKIVDERLKETFGIVKAKLKEQGLLVNMSSGGVLSGGAALFERTLDIFHDVFEFPVRVGKPFDASGAVTELSSPRYSAVWGALRYCDDFSRGMAVQGGNWIDQASNALERAFSGLLGKVSNVKNSIKI